MMCSFLGVSVIQVLLFEMLTLIDVNYRDEPFKPVNVL